MGGEIQDRETPEEAFKREAIEKLNLNVSDYLIIADPLRLRGQTGNGIRHCFVSRDPLDKVILDPKKYRRYEWVSKEGITVPRIPGAIRKVLAHVGYLEQLS